MTANKNNLCDKKGRDKLWFFLTIRSWKKDHCILAPMLDKHEVSDDCGGIGNIHWYLGNIDVHVTDVTKF